ncbi:MAG: M48 family metallopeptidase [Chloroflexota bacterium]
MIRSVTSRWTMAAALALVGMAVLAADVAAIAPNQETDLDLRILYSRTKLALALGAQFWSAAVLAGLLFAGLSARLRDLSRRLLSGRRGLLALYLLFFGLLTWLLALPLEFYSGFVVEHRFGLSTQSLSGWLLDQVQGLGLGYLVGLPMVAGLYWVIRRAPRRWWLGVAGLLILFSVVLATLAPVALSPLFNSYRPVEDPALVERIETLAGGVGVNVSEVLQEDTSRRTVKANAYFTGLGPTRRIVLTDNLVQQFTPDEVVAVIAHELGHQLHDDIWRSIAVGSGFYLVGSYLLYRLLGPILARWGNRFGFHRVEDVASLPLLLLLFGALSFAALPALNGYSRAVERQADRFSLELTRDPDSFISAMEKLGRLNLSDPDPPEALKLLFSTHPSIRERVEYARRHELEG